MKKNIFLLMLNIFCIEKAQAGKSKESAIKRYLSQSEDDLEKPYRVQTDLRLDLPNEMKEESICIFENSKINREKKDLIEENLLLTTYNNQEKPREEAKILLQNQETVERLSGIQNNFILPKEVEETLKEKLYKRLKTRKAQSRFYSKTDDQKANFWEKMNKEIQEEHKNLTEEQKKALKEKVQKVVQGCFKVHQEKQKQMCFEDREESQDLSEDPKEVLMQNVLEEYQNLTEEQNKSLKEENQIHCKKREAFEDLSEKEKRRKNQMRQAQKRYWEKCKKLSEKEKKELRERQREVQKMYWSKLREEEKKQIFEDRKRCRASLSEEEKEKLKEKMREAAKKRRANLSEAEKEKFKEKMREAAKKRIANLSEAEKEKFKERQKEAQKRYWAKVSQKSKEPKDNLENKEKGQEIFLEIESNSSQESKGPKKD